MGKINVGIIGAGRIGKVHAESIAYKLPEAKIITIADPNFEAVKEVAERLSIPNYTADYKDIINDKIIDAVLICSPTDTHANIIMEAANQKKHIFCEKPIDLSLAKIEEALSVVKQNNVKLMIGFNRRFDPNFAKIKAMMESGKIGDLHIMKITSRDPEPPNIGYIKQSGGLFMDMAIHDFDMARFLAGSEVVEVYARGGVMVDKKIGEAGDIDTAVITLTFANGAIATIDNSRKAVYGYDQRVEVFGSRGMVKVSNNKPENHCYFDSDGEHSALPLNFFMDRYTESYYQEIKLFVDALVNDTELNVVGIDGLKAAQIAIAAKQSLVENKPVKIK